MTENIFENNFEKYADPKQYDYLYDNYKNDLNLILEWAKFDEHPIIELACGTGRLTIPMAKRNFSMVGVDLHEGMLNLAKQKSIAQGVTINFYKQDCTALSLSVKSSLIYITGNSFQHFLTNNSQDALLHSVKKHLITNGVFIFDTRNPLLHEISKIDEYEQSYTNNHGEDVVEYHRDEYDVLTQILHCQTKRHIYRDETLIAKEEDNISLRFSFPLEMERLLQQHGFEILHVYGDWDKNALNANSIQMIYICRLLED